MGFYPLLLTAQTEAAAAALEQQEKKRREEVSTRVPIPHPPTTLPLQSRAV
jgi:hypothetical protein